MLADALDRELADSKRRLALQYETFQRRFEIPRSQLLLLDGDDVADEEDDVADEEDDVDDVGYDEEDEDGDIFRIDDAGNVL